MWRWLMFALCLIAALSGTPLRQAEAASDFARSLEDANRGDEIEVPDGGVGDDSGATIKAETTGASSVITLSADIPGVVSNLPVLFSWHLSNRPDRRPPRCDAALSARLACLQCFLC